MSGIKDELLTMPESSVRLNQTMINQHMNQWVNMIRNEGYIDKVKNTSNTRILFLNPRGLDPSNDS